MKRKPFGSRLAGAMSEGLSALRQGKALVMVERPSLPPPPIFTKEKVTHLRTSFGMTQKEFSELMVVSSKTIQSWEQGTRKPSGTARRVLEILQSPDKLEPVRRFRGEATRKGTRSAIKCVGMEGMSLQLREDLDATVAAVWKILHAARHRAGRSETKSAH